MERLSATMPKDVLDRLRALSYRERRPLSAQLTLIVEKYLQELEANAK
jgi:predicted DNA-binding protein